MAVELRDLQKWFQAFIVEPGSCEDALGAGERAAGFEPGAADRLIKPSPTLDPAERLMIYRRMYLLRMEEALEIDYPAVRHFLGRRAFFNLVSEYVKVHPSHSYTLDHLGDRFPEFVAGARFLPKRGFLGDLARLEQTICQVFHAPEAPVLTSQQLQAVDPADWERAVLEPIAALKLLALRYPANAYLKAFRHETEPPEIVRQDSFVVVWRENFKVWRMGLERPAFELLEALGGGRPLGQAIEGVLSRRRVRQEQLFDWFSSWVGEGMFSAVRV